MLARREATRLAQRFDAALNNMPHGLCMLDGEGKIAVVNLALLKMFGALKEQLRAGADIGDVWTRSSPQSAFRARSANAS